MTFGHRARSPTNTQPSTRPEVAKSTALTQSSSRPKILPWYKTGEQLLDEKHPTNMSSSTAQPFTGANASAKARHAHQTRAPNNQIEADNAIIKQEPLSPTSSTHQVATGAPTFSVASSTLGSKTSAETFGAPVIKAPGQHSQYTRRDLLAPASTQGQLVLGTKPYHTWPPGNHYEDGKNCMSPKRAIIGTTAPKSEFGALTEHPSATHADCDPAQVRPTVSASQTNSSFGAHLPSTATTKSFHASNYAAGVNFQQPSAEKATQQNITSQSNPQYPRYGPPPSYQAPTDIQKQHQKQSPNYANTQYHQPSPGPVLPSSQTSSRPQLYPHTYPIPQFNRSAQSSHTPTGTKKSQQSKQKTQLAPQKQHPQPQQQHSLAQASTIQRPTTPNGSIIWLPATAEMAREQRLEFNGYVDVRRLARWAYYHPDWAEYLRAGGGDDEAWWLYRRWKGFPGYKVSGWYEVYEESKRRAEAAMAAELQSVDAIANGRPSTPNWSSTAAVQGPTSRSDSAHPVQ